VSPRYTRSASSSWASSSDLFDGRAAERWGSTLERGDLRRRGRRHEFWAQPSGSSPRLPSEHLRVGLAWVCSIRSPRVPLVRFVGREAKGGRAGWRRDVRRDAEPRPVLFSLAAPVCCWRSDVLKALLVRAPRADFPSPLRALRGRVVVPKVPTRSSESSSLRSVPLCSSPRACAATSTSRCSLAAFVARARVHGPRPIVTSLKSLREPASPASSLGFTFRRYGDSSLSPRCPKRPEAASDPIREAFGGPDVEVAPGAIRCPARRNRASETSG